MDQIFPELLNIKDYGVITFDTTHDAVKSEVILKEQQARFLLIPTPRSISASCGMAVKFLWEDKESIIAILLEQGVRYHGVHHIVKG
ncbi:DUF3343 domain-containing protein [Metallumcola ferriviriculae]|uniref:DUF3343 domain-containing protein n=1 Tax=Metallumcola ferriviriculae TaxID=3039180 RepID=A0AAU0UIL6_9FIRM|nr:DUF3343 domain-containing protein [Desulfitibacteraceae bacterium MK1]